MKSLREKINWYEEPETRKWKRIWHCIEVFLFVLAMIVVLAIMQIYGDGTKLQGVVTLFIVIMALSCLFLVPYFYSPSVLKRWQMQLITLGLGCGAGISAVAAFVVLELQSISS
ncbi:MAG: hypothetical protein AAF434_13695 [Pseudomonadota bacterium]